MQISTLFSTINFRDGISCKATRTLIRTKHKSLYRGLVKKHETGKIKDGEGFKHFLRNGRRSNGEILIYSYVINESTLFFSPTGDDFLKDATSKHCVHSNCAENITYAGEFFLFDKSKDNTREDFTLIINNSSGTYKPDKKLLSNLKELMEYNFPGLAVDCVSIDDEKYKKYEKKVETHNKSIEGELFFHFPEKQS